MAMYMDPEDLYDFSGDLLPCEFCEELFPLDLFIEHQSGCRADLLHFAPKENITEKPKLIEQEIKVSDVNTSNKQQHKVEITTESKQKAAPPSKYRNLKFDIYGDIPKEGGNAEKLMVYESANNKTVKNEEEVIISQKIQNTEHTVYSTAKTDSSIDDNRKLQNNDDCCISDDDDDDECETIESFLRQAAIVLKQRLAVPSQLPQKYLQYSKQHTNMNTRNPRKQQNTREEKSNWTWRSNNN